MKQNMKRVLLVLSMAFCLFALSACAKKEDAALEPVPETVVDTMISGAENYLMQFDSYDDETIASEIKRVEKQKNTVMSGALNSWKGIKGDLGKLSSGQGAFLSEEVERLSEDSYRVTIRASYEKREMTFTLSAQEVTGSNYSGGMALMPTELIFAPDYTTGEKLSKAGKNTLMGMATVFCVLILISFIISALKGVNTLEANAKAKKDAKDAAKEAAQKAAPAAAAAPTPAPAAAAAPAPAAPVAPAAPAVSAAAVQEPAPAEEENLADDLELVAVITAAIAAASSVPVEGLVVRSIRRKPASKWKNA